MQGRLATADDTAAVVRTLAGAFFADPVWGWAFGDTEQRKAGHAAWFALVVHSGLANGSVWTTSGGEAVAVWVPPNCPELTDLDEARLKPMIEEVAGPRSALLMEIFDRFDDAHPHDREHYYLSLLGTHPDHRGRGLGMGLLTENLARLDAAGVPAYLESSNPANVQLYEAVGFTVHGSFAVSDGGPRVTTMWREPRTR